ncbi:protein associated with UVRAG as autophagy enhancer [Toxotes jaculatrix]|uniref:protein associated with UVRAG as autophagy enhancer n=1 Tax=Toxotes jaculatrix TaxID=941984 RepID=UPI001B3AAD73|nr:protein associated with UVRAG as autophagy enhancer [Toxotes jaculatrix]XP_040912666.1 protein associated with UVRAG as autophagy enhancer [Toxotes jaculatrix]
MGTCRGMSSSQCRSRYISWCVDSLTEPPTPVTTAVTAAEFFQPNHRSADSGPIPLLLLPPPETAAGGTAFTPQLPQRTRHKAFLHSHLSKPNPHSSSTSHNTDKAANSVSDVCEDDDSEEGRKGTLKSPEDEKISEEDSSLPHAGVDRLLLPRSSPVISRHHRPISWHGEETNTSAPSSLDSSSPDSGSLSPKHHGLPTVASMEDLGSKPSSSHRSSPTQEEKKLRCVSLSSNLNHFLTSLFHLPFSGQQGLAEERRGQRPISCDASHTPGVSASAQPTKQRSSSAVPEFSADIFKTSCELEKENAHFIVVDMVLEVLEGVKWTLSCDRWTSIMDTHQTTGYNMSTRGYTGSAEDSPTCEHKQRCKVNRHTQSRRSDRRTHSSYVHTNQHTQDKDEAEGQPKTFSVLSTDSGFEDCGAETTLTPKDSLRNAECLAQQLVLQFRRSWFPSCELRRGRQSLRSSLQELPGTGSVAANSSSLTEEIRLRTRMRGSLSWAPPRFQIIFTVQPTLRRSEVVALQHFLCAGCGTEVEPRYIKKLRYCEYLGRYFCDCCHSGSEALIPGRVLSSWDFCKYPVSDFSKQLLDSVWHQPLFDLTCVGKTLCSKVKELDRFKELQEQLLFLRKLLKACRFSGGVMTEFEQLPAHLISEPPHLFSMDDLLRLKKGQLVAQARAVLNSAISHVESCELCQARGFICEFCRERDIIFPFQSECRRCPVCKACFHKLCFVEKKCPKCARIQSRKKRRDGSMKCDG